MSDSRLRRLRDRSSGPATLINDGCKINGTISGNGDYLINGAVEGDCDIEGTVTLAQNGLWAGTIRATTVIVSGHIDGSASSASDSRSSAQSCSGWADCKALRPCISAQRL